MPELPDVTVYVEALQKRLVGQALTKMRLANPFVLRTVDPSPSEAAGRRVTDIRRLGKRIVLELEGELFIVIHLMIAGRFKWLPANAKIPGKLGLAAFDFPNGTLLLTEAGSKRRASTLLGWSRRKSWRCRHSLRAPGLSVMPRVVGPSTHPASHPASAPRQRASTPPSSPRPA